MDISRIYRDNLNRLEELEAAIEAHRFLYNEHELGCACRLCADLRSLISGRHELETQNNNILYAVLTKKVKLGEA